MFKLLRIPISIILIFIPYSAVASGYFDSMDGPVITDAKKALKNGNVKIVLKWVEETHEDQIKKTFQQTMAVRTKGSEAKELADRHFFEILVRLHCESKGVDYTGLKPKNSDTNVAVMTADNAIEKGKVDNLIYLYDQIIAKGLKERLNQLLKTRKNADQSVRAGRKYVSDYVEFIHFVNKLYLDSISLLGDIPTKSWIKQATQPLSKVKQATQPVTINSLLEEYGESPSENLKKDHLIIQAVLQVAVEEARSIRETQEADMKRIHKLINFFRNFVDICHFGKEEEYYFPIIHAFGGPEVQKLTEQLKEEHLHSRILISELSNLADVNKQDFKKAEKAFEHFLVDYIELIEQHIEKEEKILFPIAEKLIPKHKKKAILAGFEDIRLEKLGKGFHEKYRRMALELVQGLE